jgi:hypothetical protein
VQQALNANLQVNVQQAIAVHTLYMQQILWIHHLAFTLFQLSTNLTLHQLELLSVVVIKAQLVIILLIKHWCPASTTPTIIVFPASLETPARIISKPTLHLGISRLPRMLLLCIPAIPNMFQCSKHSYLIILPY